MVETASESLSSKANQLSPGVSAQHPQGLNGHVGRVVELQSGSLQRHRSQPFLTAAGRRQLEGKFVHTRVPKKKRRQE